MSRPSPATPRPRTTWRSSCSATPALPDVDLHPPVARLRHLVWRRHQRLALAAALHPDALGRHAHLDQLVADALRATEGERVVVGHRPHAVGVADDHDLGSGPTRQLVDDAAQDLARIRRQLVARLEEVEEEGYRPIGLRGQRGAERLARLLLGHGARRDPAGLLHPRGRVRLVEHRLLARAVHREGAGLAVRARHQHVEVVARGLGAADQQQEAEGRERRVAHRGLARQSFLGSPVRTRNSVPRTPSTAAGVFTFIASGDCLASLPETTASVPARSELSKPPWWVVESNAKRSIASTLFGPAESRLLSRKVMPTEPSAPVVTTSPACTAAPIAAGAFCPARSISTTPRATLT